MDCNRPTDKSLSTDMGRPIRMQGQEMRQPSVVSKEQILTEILILTCRKSRRSGFQEIAVTILGLLLLRPW
jgi:hypothetical protein